MRKVGRHGCQQATAIVRQDELFEFAVDPNLIRFAFRNCSSVTGNPYLQLSAGISAAEALQSATMSSASSCPPKLLGGHGLEVAAVAAEGGHYRCAVVPDRWKCHAIFRLKTGWTHCAFKDDGRRIAAHLHVDAWIVEVHLTLLRRVRNSNLCPYRRRDLQTTMRRAVRNHECRMVVALQVNTAVLVKRAVALSSRPFLLCSANGCDKLSKRRRVDCTRRMHGI